MPFEPGQSGNPAGKPVGALSKKTQARNAMIEFMVNEGIPSGVTALQELRVKNPEAYLKRLDPWMEYVLEKLARVELTGPDGADLFAGVDEEKAKKMIEVYNKSKA